MQELNDFYNNGFGWICRRCERDLAPQTPVGSRSRLLTEGEAESKQPAMSSKALAKWLDRTRTTLICPQCGITERADGS